MNVTNAVLAVRARELADRHAPRTPDRRAAAAAHTALVTTGTPEAARKALASFAGPAVRAAAAAIIDDLERTTTS